MLTPAEMESLRRFVGYATFSRGLDYARRGAVRRVRWTEDGACAFGEVQGGAPAPYGVTAIVRRSTSNIIVGIDAVCTCPVEINCKHAVALLLANGVRTIEPLGTAAPEPRAGTGRKPAAGKKAKGPGWETPLHALMADGTADLTDAGRSGRGPVLGPRGRDRTAVRVGPDPAQDQRSGRVTTSGIRLRPVVRSHSGNWVRTDISWSNLEYFSYRRSVHGTGAAHLTILTELLALARVAGHRSTYATSTEAVWLQTINSRRLWDLLVEARDLQLPLLQARPPGPARRPPARPGRRHSRRHPGRRRPRAPPPGAHRRCRRPPRPRHC